MAVKKSDISYSRTDGTTYVEKGRTFKFESGPNVKATRSSKVTSDEAHETGHKASYERNFKRVGSYGQRIPYSDEKKPQIVENVFDILGSSFFGYIAEETPKYQLVEKLAPDIEIRNYDKAVAIETD